MKTLLLLAALALLVIPGGCQMVGPEQECVLELRADANLISGESGSGGEYPAGGIDAGPDGYLASIESSVPGFGGYVYDSQARTVGIYLLQPDSARALAAHVKLTSYYSDLNFRKARPYPIQGQYGYASLLEWYRKAYHTFWTEVPELTGSDIDEGRNRISIHIRAESGRSKVFDVASRLGIPEGAILTPLRQEARKYGSWCD